MPERLHRTLQSACLILGLLVAYQLCHLVVFGGPPKSLNFTAMPASASIAEKKTSETNSPPRSAASRSSTGAKQDGDIPSAVQSRVDRIVQSEIFGALPRPMPMALLGIAGRDVFLRAPNGQTGLIREGEELGGVKLLRIGTNRVLVEQDGQEKELTLFSGFGSESLLPKGDKIPRETLVPSSH